MRRGLLGNGKRTTSSSTGRDLPDGKLLHPARITLLHNGVLVQDNVELTGPTAHGERPPYKQHAGQSCRCSCRITEIRCASAISGFANCTKIEARLVAAEAVDHGWSLRQIPSNCDAQGDLQSVPKNRRA